MPRAFRLCRIPQGQMVKWSRVLNTAATATARLIEGVAVQLAEAAVEEVEPRALRALLRPAPVAAARPEVVETATGSPVTA